MDENVRSMASLEHSWLGLEPLAGEIGNTDRLSVSHTHSLTHSPTPRDERGEAREQESTKLALAAALHFHPSPRGRSHSVIRMNSLFLLLSFFTAPPALRVANSRV